MPGDGTTRKLLLASREALELEVEREEKVSAQQVKKSCLEVAGGQLEPLACSHSLLAVHSLFPSLGWEPRGSR